MIYVHKTIEDLLETYRLLLGPDFDKYSNHVYRVFLNCRLIDNNKLNEEKYALAAVFHDIGIWTNYTIDYLNPSIEQAKSYLQNVGKQALTEEISLMIYWHHKTTKYKNEHCKTVETFRQADWIDVSLGLINFGFDKQVIQRNRRAFKNLGFHFFLMKKIIKNFFHHPFKPLPMFKK